MSIVKIDLLKKARVLLAARPSKPAVGICWALDRAADADPAPNILKAADELANYISDAIEPYSYLPSWIRHRTGVVIQWAGEEDLQRLLTTRLAWIDWMINCYEEDMKNE